MEVGDRVLVGLVRESSRKNYLKKFEEGVADLYYTGPLFPTSKSLHDLHYFIPYFKGKGIRDVYEIKRVRTIKGIDRREYKTIEARAEKALAFARRHNMNEHYALFVDYSIPSGTPRLFVWDFHQKKIVASTYVMHGPGGGSTAERPVFSNKPGSECSALGRFLVTKEHGNTLKRSFRIKGMDLDNQSAYTMVGV